MMLTHSPHVPTPDSKNPKSTDSLANFRDMMHYADKLVGKLVDHLKELNLLENTLIIFTSDNGTSKSIVAKMQNGDQYKGGKGSMTNRGTHVALLAYWQGKTPQGVVLKDLVDFSDFLPTLVQAGGATLPTDRVIDGVSFFPQLLGQAGTPREWAFCNYWYQGRTKEGEKQWIRTAKYKIYENGDFFDVDKDIDEKIPIPKGSGTEFVETQRKILQQAMDKLAPKIESFDYSKEKKKEYEQQYEASRAKALKAYNKNPAVFKLVTQIEKLKQDRDAVIAKMPMAKGLDDKEMEKMLNKNKFSKEDKSLKPLVAKIADMEDQLSDVLRGLDQDFDKAAAIMDKYDTLGKAGQGKGDGEEG